MYMISLMVVRVIVSPRRVSGTVDSFVNRFPYVSFFFNDTATTEIYTLSLHDALPILLTSRLSLSKHLAHNLGNLLLLGKIGVFHNRRNASSRLLLLISKHLILCIYLVFRILA